MPNKLLRGIICLAAVVIIWMLPCPAGLKAQAWHMFALFAGTILAFVLQPMPNGPVVILSMLVAVATGMITLNNALQSWANSIIWLILAAFMFSRGLIKSGLGQRIAFWVTRAFGDSTLKLAYALSFVDLVLSPATPSNSARAGGILFPIVKSLSVSLDSEPGPTARRAGAFLFLSLFFADCTTSAMFMTSMVSNPLIAELGGKTLNISITWASWFQAAIVPGIISLLAVPLFLYMFYPPELKKIPEAKNLAAEELAKMGPISTRETCMAIIFCVVLVLWASSIYTRLDATFIGLIGVILMLLTNVINWQDVLEEKAAWNVFIWLGGVIGLAGFLAQFGFISWFAKVVSAPLAGIPWIASWILVVLVYFYTYYGFAGLTPHVVLMFSGFAAVAVAAGTPPYLAALALGFSSSLCATLTNYGCAPATVFYGAGYVDQVTWYKQGFLTSIINLVIWLGIGSIWWKMLGLW